MHMSLLPTGNASTDVIIWLYLLTNAGRIFTYLPQIHAVWRDTQGARSLSLLTWCSWAVSHVCALLYAVVVAHDAPLTMISGINLLGCGCVTTLAIRRRLQWRRGPAGAALALPASGDHDPLAPQHCSAPQRASAA